MFDWHRIKLKNVFKKVFWPDELNDEKNLCFSMLHVITLVELFRPAFLYTASEIAEITRVGRSEYTSIFYFLLALGSNIANRRGATTITSYIFIITFQLSLYVYAWTSGGVFDATMSTTILTAFWAGFLLPKIYTIILATLSVVIGYFMVFASYSEFLPAPQFLHSAPSYWNLLAFNILSLVVTQILINRIVERVKSDRVRALQQITVAKQELQRLVNVKDNFLANLSHELRTPLTTILGWTDLIMNEDMNESTRQRGLETIRLSADRQNRLISDLIELSRLERGEGKLSISRVPVIAVIKEALDLVRFQAEQKHIQWRLVDNGVDIAFPADRRRVRQVLWNIFANAIKFSRENGVVEIILELDDEYIVIRVRDYGVGISEWFRPHIFENFSQAESARSRQFSGLGIGLTISKLYMDLHGGEIQVKSEGENRGSEFIIKFPLKEHEGAAA